MARTPRSRSTVKAHLFPRGLVPRLREGLLFDSVVFDPSTLEFLVPRGSDGSVLLGPDHPIPSGDPHPCRVMAETKLTETVKSEIPGGRQCACSEFEETT